jgi:predicted permease
MTTPIAVRDVAAAVGLLIVLGTAVSVVGTVIVPRKSGSRLTRLVATAVNATFRLIVRPVGSYRWRDRIMAAQAAVIVLGQLAVWLGSFYVGYTLLIWPTTRSIGVAFRSVGPALWTFGSPDTHGFFETAVLDTAAMAGLVTVTLQIAYLPALYAAFNRRENEIALLNSRAGSPSWGPELLARTHYALGSGTSALDTLPGFYGEWERWAADITESHAEFLDAVGRLREVNFPVEREPEAAWPHFVGWRVNYEQAAYAIAAAIDAVPALWSGPRRWPAEPMPPLRPMPGVPFP